MHNFRLICLNSTIAEDCLTYFCWVFSGNWCITFDGNTHASEKQKFTDKGLVLTIELLFFKINFWIFHYPIIMEKKIRSSEIEGEIHRNQTSKKLWIHVANFSRLPEENREQILI